MPLVELNPIFISSHPRPPPSSARPSPTPFPLHILSPSPVLYRNHQYRHHPVIIPSPALLFKPNIIINSAPSLAPNDPPTSISFSPQQPSIFQPRPSTSLSLSPLIETQHHCSSPHPSPSSPSRPIIILSGQNPCSSPSPAPASLWRSSLSPH